MAAASIVRSDPAPPEPAAPDGVLLAFMRLCRQLERPVTEAELRAAVSLPEAGADLASLRKLAGRFGFALESLRLSPARLARLAPPFMILGRQPGQAWVVRGRTEDQVLLADPVAGVVGAAHAGWKGALAGVVESADHKPTAQSYDVFTELQQTLQAQLEGLDLAQIMEKDGPMPPSRAAALRCCSNHRMI